MSDKMPIAVVLFYSIPETIVVLSLSLTLLGEDIKKYFSRVILLGFVFAAISYVIRSIPVVLGFGFHSFFLVILFIIFASLILKVSLKKASVIILNGFVFLVIAETIFMPQILKILGITFEEMLNNTVLRILIPWVDLAALIIFTIILYRKKISFLPLLNFLNFKTKSNRINFWLTITIFVQAAILGMVNLSLLFDQRWAFLDNRMVTYLFAFFSLNLLIISIFLVRKLMLMAEQEAVIETQEAYSQNIQNLFTAFRGQRHDFLNHVQTLYAMILTGSWEEAKNYMLGILGEINEVNNVVKINNTPVSALFMAKLAIADRKIIKLNLNVEASLEGTKVKPFEMVKILGNLIDNAIDAVEGLPTEERIVDINISKENEGYRIEVANYRPIIPSQYLDKIFEGGVTTKRNGEHSGLGLAVVKSLVEKYKGNVSVESTPEKGTIFTVILPL